ncbi:MAG: hypothetical protein ABIG93_03705 [archaeon]|nr:hypothetical protein [Nanoarchaeota archaeon]
MKKFNLLELHDERIDVRPFSWICFDLNNETRRTINFILRDILQKYQYKKDLINYLAEQLNCSYDTIEKYLSFRKSWFSIPLFLELLKISSKSKSKLVKEINSNIKLLKTAGSTSQKVKALKQLTIPLCEIAGAHAADGTLPLRINIIFKTKPELSLIDDVNKKFGRKVNVCYDSSIKHCYFTFCSNEDSIAKLLPIVKDYGCFERIKVSYFLRIVEGSKLPLEKLAKQFNNCFEIVYSPQKFKEVGAWHLTIGNKIIIRHLIKFLGFNHGAKSNSVSIPSIIKTSSLIFNDAFVRGFLQFDGSVELDGNINLQTKSKLMSVDLANYFNKKKIISNCSKKVDKKGCYTIKVRKKSNKDLSFLFFPGTTKYELLTRNYSYKPASLVVATDYLNRFSHSSMSVKLGDFLMLFNCKDKTLYELKSKISRETEVGYSTLYKYLEFLLSCDVLERYKSGKVYKYKINSQVQKWRIPIKR